MSNTSEEIINALKKLLADNKNDLEKGLIGYEDRANARIAEFIDKYSLNITDFKKYKDIALFGNDRGESR
jgi:hypothetical protein